MTLVTTEFSPLDIMFELVLEDGRPWGEVAVERQIDDVEAIFAKDGANKHFITRPRGGSKTSDLAGIAVSWLRAGAPRRSRGYVVASNADQAAELIDAGAGFIDRTPQLDVLRVENERIINDDNGAWARVLPASEAGAWGKRDTHLLICDEFAQWPDTRGAKRVWVAVRTTVQKTPGCQLVILTSAGEPSHWSYPIFQNAETAEDWRVSQMPGPVPWQDPAELESIRQELIAQPSMYERLILNRWTAAEDRAISPEDYESAARPCIIHGAGRRVTLLLEDFEDARPGVKYVIFVDIGTVNDATVIVVAHTEPLSTEDETIRGDRHGPKRLIIDRLDRWQGTKKAPVQLSQVEEHVAGLSAQFNKARVVADPMQFVGHLQNLNKRGVKAEEFTFGATTVGQVATSLVQTFRNQLIVIPDAPVLKDELLKVKLRESSPGVTRLDHDRSSHDDQAVTLGMAAHTLIGAVKSGSGEAFRQFMRTQRERCAAEAPGTDSREDAAFRRHLRTMQRRQGPRREKQAPRCQHRWRGDVCVFGCGTTRDQVAS